MSAHSIGLALIDGTSLPNWSGAASVAISALSFCISLFSLTISYLGYRLSAKKEQRSGAAFNVYHVGNYEETDDAIERLAFNVELNNLSDTAMTASRAYLSTDFDSEGAGTIRLLTDSTPASFKRGFQGEFLQLPLKIDARGSARGWISFNLDRAAFNRKSVRSRHVIFLDTQGNKADFEFSVLIRQNKYTNEEI